MKSKIRFKVRYIFQFNGGLKAGIESEASWFLVDQQGEMYSYGPMKPIRPVSESYTECEPLLKINNEWLSIEEIEKKINKQNVPLQPPPPPPQYPNGRKNK